jgi:uncharacterized protein involved in exopolysaccharide biosynthesis
MYASLGGNGLLRRSFFVLSALVIAFVLAALAAGRARAAFPGTSGKLVLESVARSGRREAGSPAPAHPHLAGQAP